MDLSHLAWPFFDVEHRQFAAEFELWATARLGEFEQCEGGDGSDARQIFKLLAAAGWLDKTLPQGTGRLDLRSVSLLREICGHSSAMADVALSEPWLGILPVALYGSLELKQQFLPGYLSGQLIPRDRSRTTRRCSRNFPISNRASPWFSEPSVAGR